MGHCLGFLTIQKGGSYLKIKYLLHGYWLCCKRLPRTISFYVFLVAVTLTNDSLAVRLAAGLALVVFFSIVLLITSWIVVRWFAKQPKRSQPTGGKK